MPEPPWKRVKELFHEAVALPAEQRPALLEAACAGDADLRAAVETLLRHDGEDTNILAAGPVAREAAEARRRARAAPVLPQVPEYELLRELGRGGMGIVYLARHLPLKRFVALKMLPATPATAEQLARFRMEAEALARLQHPNIVPIYDVGEFEGHPYFTMEYVAGPSLAHLLDGRHQDVSDSARLLEVLARAVHAVHKCGIIHRDLKPANILLAACGLALAPSKDEASAKPQAAEPVPKITDFGLAKDRTSARQLTETGVIMGTPCYMAPEQVRNRRGGVGPGADIYALGSILYELLTGRPPFDAATPIEVIAQLLHREPLSPSRLRPRLPADLVTICLKCLEKSPRRRYASAWHLAEDLRRFRAGEPIRARPVGPVGRAYRWCLRRPLVAGLMALSASLAVALVVMVVGYEVRLNAEELASARVVAEAERRQIVQLNVTIGLVELEDGDTFTAVLRFAEALRLDAGDEERESPHRARIAVALRQCPRLLRMETVDGEVLCANQGPSGVRVVTIGPDHVLEVRDVLAGQTNRTPLKLEDVPAGAALSPDGKSLATIDARGAALMWDLQTGKSHALPVPGKGAVYSALSEDARWLFTRDSTGVAQVWEVATGKPAGPPLPPGQAVTGAAIGADGRRLALIDAEGDLRVWDVATAARVAGPMRPRRPVGHVGFSPDGRRLVACDGSGARVWDAVTGQALTPPLRHGAPLAWATLDADGKQLVTVSRRGTVCVWELPASPEAVVAEPPPDDRPVAAIRELAEFLACSRIDENQQPQALEERALRDAWARLHPAP